MLNKLTKKLISIFCISFLIIFFIDFAYKQTAIIQKPKSIAYAIEDWGMGDVFINDNLLNFENMPNVFLEHEFIEEDLLRISVNVKNVVDPLIGIAFHLNFDEDKMAFLKYLPSEFFEQGGTPIYLVKEQDSKIIYGESLRKDDLFPIGQGKVVDFYFQLLKPAPYEFTFERGVLATMEPVLQNLTEIYWENYEIENNTDNFSPVLTTGKKSIFYKLFQVFSLKNIALALFPSTILLLSLWIYYINKLKPRMIKQNI